jgi:hypothetical protein
MTFIFHARGPVEQSQNSAIAAWNLRVPTRPSAALTDKDEREYTKAAYDWFVKYYPGRVLPAEWAVDRFLALFGYRVGAK